MNEARKESDLGPMGGVVNMILLNKKKKMVEYVGKRKILKFNKDVNLLGKIWTKRCTNIVLPQTLPRNQFCCVRLTLTKPPINPDHRLLDQLPLQ